MGKLYGLFLCFVGVSILLGNLRALLTGELWLENREGETSMTSRGDSPIIFHFVVIFTTVLGIMVLRSGLAHLHLFR